MSDDESDNGGGSQRTYKIVLLGDEGVGKTSIINRFTKNKFSKNQLPSEGVDFFGKNVVHASKNHRLQLWDTSGNERYRKLIPNYLKNATCGLFIYDRTDLTTLQNLENWIKIFKESRKQRATIALCENKNDLSFSAHKNKFKTINDPNNTIQSKSELQIQVNSNNDEQLFAEKVKQLKGKYNMTHFSVSAAEGKEIHDMFHDLIDQIKENWLNTSGSASKIKELMDQERLKYKIEEYIAQKAEARHLMPLSNSLMTEQAGEKSSTTTNFQLKSSIEFDSKPLDLNDNKGKRRRKVHRVNNIPTMESHQDIELSDANMQPPPSIWSRICPCIFR